MAELATLARPYAQAAYNFAQKSDSLPQWSDALHTAASVTADASFSGLIGDPRLSNDKLCQLLVEIGGDGFTDHIKNFLGTIVENGRLKLLPEVAQEFDKLRNIAENRIEVEVVSAYVVKKDQQTLLIAALEKRFGKQVVLTTRTDKSLIGGLIIRAGDEVIDGSVLGGLNQLATQLHHS